MLPTVFVRLVLLALFAGATVRAASVAPRMLLLDGALVGPAIVVVGERGTILRSTDQGHTWQSVAVPTTATLTGVSFAPGTLRGWAVGHDALILTTADGGLSWQTLWQGKKLQDSFLDVLAVNDHYVIAIGAYGLFAYSDGGADWSPWKVVEDDYHLNRITQGPGGHGYFLAGEHGTLMVSAERGLIWRSRKSEYEGSFYGILPVDAQTLVAYGLRGRIYRSVDSGANWILVPNEQQALIATALKLKDGVIIFAGQARSWLISRDGGKSVSPLPAPITTGVAELLELPDGSILALGDGGASLIPHP